MVSSVGSVVYHPCVQLHTGPGGRRGGGVHCAHTCTHWGAVTGPPVLWSAPTHSTDHLWLPCSYRLLILSPPTDFRNNIPSLTQLWLPLYCPLSSLMLWIHSLQCSWSASPPPSARCSCCRAGRLGGGTYQFLPKWTQCMISTDCSCVYSSLKHNKPFTMPQFSNE